MSDDIYLAFAHPNERSFASGRVEFDRISVRDFVLDVEIGAFQAERGVNQLLRFNVVVEVLPWDGPLDDDVDRILSYDKVTEAIEAELTSERLNLLETLAERVAERILIEPQAERTYVRIEKLDRGPATLGVEIVRSASQVTPSEDIEDSLHPIILHISDTAMPTDTLRPWIDAAATSQTPVIISVGCPDQDLVVAEHPMAQRRVDLLGIEQNAWALAAKDLRCVVVDTRTELDWGMRNDQISVWAPSKMVLDAVDGTDGTSVNARDLTAWFAEEMAAAKLIVIGADNGWPVGTLMADADKVGL